MSAALQYTPGPWGIDRLSDTVGLLIKPCGGQVVCEIDPLDEAEGNAALISAAPELLETLRTLAAYPIARGYPDGPCIDSADMNDIRAVIAKAEGRAA